MSDKELSPREKLIRAKTAAGLSREQAEQVIAAQEENDAAVAAEAAKKAKAQKQPDAKL
jgi:hypothetical protein